MTGAAARPVVLVLARHFARGPVKTRLAADIGADAARAAYRRVAEAVWTGLADPRITRWLLVEPADAVAEASDWLPGAGRVQAQVPGDLGERLAAGFRAAFAAGAPAALAVGTDAPAVTAELVLSAAQALQQHDVAMVPSLDGGYALIGMQRAHLELFRDIPWSSATVLASTRARLRAAGLRWSELAPVRDLDTLEDLRALQAEGLLPA